MASYIINGVSQNLINVNSGDTLQAVSGGITNAMNVYEGGTAFISAGGTGTHVTVFYGGELYLGPNGGQLEITRISGGKFYMNGGNASRTYLSSTGSMFLNDGSANSAYVTGSKSYLEVNGGILHSGVVGGDQEADSKWRPLIKVSSGNLRDTEVRSGGTVWMTGGAASSAYIREGGLWSMTGGRMSSATLFQGGSVIIANAKVDSVHISGDMNISSGGTVTVANGGSLTNADADFGGTVKVNNGGYASSVAVSYGGILEVNGGTAENIRSTNLNGGIVNVKNGGIVSNLLFSNTHNTHNQAVLNVSTGGSASGGKIIEQVNVSYGGKVSELNIYSSGVLTLYGGTATSTNVLINGRMNVSGGTALDTQVCPLVTGITSGQNYRTPASMTVSADGSASNTVVSQGGNLIVSGRATDTTVSSGGYAGVNGGIAYNLHVACDGGASVSDGGIVSGGSVTGGTFNVRESGSAGNVEVWGGNGGANKGLLLVSAGGFVSGTTAGAGGSMFIYEGAAGVDTVVSYGTVSVSGGWLSNTTVTSGNLYVSGGGTALKTTANENGRIYVLKGGILSSATVKAGGTASIASGATAGSLTVEAGGTASIDSGGILGPLTVETGGTVNIASGAVISDPLTFNGGTITFDISAIGPSAVPLIADLSLVTGTPDYQISVANDQAAGTYILAGGATGFDRTITVRNSGNGDTLGDLAVGEPQQFATGHFKLKIENDELLLLVSNVSLGKPTVLQVTPSTTAMTNQSVTVSATFSANAVYKEFSFDQTSWMPYSEAVEIGSNGMVYFRCSNSEGTSDIRTYTVNNIDKIPPDAPTVTADTQALTAGPVTISATFSQDSLLRQYSVDGGTNWLTYAAPIVAETNGTWFFRGVDEAGNASPLKAWVVGNIVEAGAPEAPTVSADITSLTNQDVTVTAAFSSDSVYQEYSLDNQTWQSYTGGVKLTANGFVYFRGKNSMGTASPVAYWEVGNIDKTPPEKPIAGATTTAPTNQDVTVTAVFSPDSEKKEYSLDNQTWQSYTGGIKLTANVSVYFRGLDAAGNLSQTTVFTVNNIDKTPPEKPAANADITTSTDQNVTVTAVFSEDSVQKQYSFDNVNWADYTSGIVFSENGTVYFRGIDAAGNVSEATSYTVGNIQIQIGSYEFTGNADSPLPVNLNASGHYTLTGSFGDITGSVTVLNGGKKAGTGTVKDGVLTFNKGNSILLDSSLPIEVQVTVKKGTDTNYTLNMNAETVFPTYDPAGGDQGSAMSLGTVSAPGQVLIPNGWVGYGDALDYYAFHLDHAANLILDCTANGAAKFTLYNGSTGKSMLSSTLKGGTLTTKAKLLEAGNYYLAVQSTNAKKGGSADYSVSVSQNARFFTRGDNSDDTFESARDLGVVSGPGVLDTDWVGVGDAIDYRKITLTSAGKLSFRLQASDAAKLMVYQTPGGKAVGTATVKGSGTASTKDIFVSAGTYYLAVQSTKAKKDGYADYSVALNESSHFFPAGDNTNNTWQAASAKPAKLAGEEITGWVGFGDAADFIKFQVAGDGKIQLDLDGATAGALAGKQIKLSCLDADGKAVKLVQDGNSLFSKTDVAIGEYYLGVTCANVKKFDTSYSITTGLLAV